MNAKGNVGVIVLIIAVTAAIIFSLLWVRSTPIVCKWTGSCILLPNEFTLYRTTSTVPYIPAPVIYSEPPVNVIECRYYSLDSIKFSWEIPPAVEGVNYVFSENLNYEFPKVSKGRVSEAAYDLRPLVDGDRYFSVAFNERGYWGPITVKHFLLDRTPPESFDITRVDKDISSNRPVFGWKASDRVSGVAYEKAKIGEGEWFNPEILKNEDGDYVLPEQSTKYSRILAVRAYDFAGNFRDSVIQFSVVPKTEPASLLYRLLIFFTSWWILPLTIIEVLFTLYLIGLRFKRLRDAVERDAAEFGKELRREINKIEKDGFKR